jgi:hypothetical protein
MAVNDDHNNDNNSYTPMGDKDGSEAEDSEDNTLDALVHPEVPAAAAHNKEQLFLQLQL